MNTYFSVRLLKASTYNKAIQKVEDGDFIDDHKLSDVVVTRKQLIKLITPMNKNATGPRKKNMVTKTNTGKIPDSVGFGGTNTGGGVTRKLTKRELAQQKANIKAMRKAK